ncbi:MAG: hypothetical protein ACO1OB_01550 [Archangium sp.]
MFDARGDVKPAEVKAALREHGALFVVNTGLRDVAGIQSVMPALGFGEDLQFSLGGRTSAAKQEKWVAPGLRRMDFYPPDLYLLPNNEVQYRRTSPRWVLFGCLRPAEVGGRVFLHDAREVEALLPRELVAKLDREGLFIETGFLDASHPLKAQNYFQSWQERFGTDVREAAMARALEQNDEYDEAWWREDGTLMTRITLSSRWPGGALKFPRIALDGPSALNGFRRFTEFSEGETQQLRDAFLSTRQGIELRAGDLVLFDNERFGHSRESFEGERDFVVGMAKDEVVQRSFPSFTSTANRYELKLDTSPQFSARVLHGLDFDLIRREFERHGAVHVKNTGLRELTAESLQKLNFGDVFPWGGMHSGRTARRELTKELRATDAYPQHLWLLPHNEVLYQHELPQRLLFFSATACVGRTFVHSAKRLRELVERRAPKLIDALKEHGFLIEMGFLDENDPAKSQNYFRSWQDRFETHDRELAEERCRASTLQFDDCWWHGSTLMTRIRVPAFHGETILFPRLALDGPSIINGFRRYPLGNGVEFTDDEVNVLLNAFLDTREGTHWEAGDLLLVDNLRYGHSREPCSGPRDIGVAMAGRVRIG